MPAAVVGKTAGRPAFTARKCLLNMARKGKSMDSTSTSTSLLPQGVYPCAGLLTAAIVMLCGSAIFAQSLAGVDLAAMKEWNIVVAEDAIPSERYAAEEFQRLFAEAAAVELPIVTSVRRPGHHVFIGPGAAMRASNVGFDIKKFGDEDLRIVIRDGNIAIAGGRPRGTLYGTYTFLEDYLGVRFLTHDHTYVPTVGKWRVVGPVDRFYHPPLELLY